MHLYALDIETSTEPLTAAERNAGFGPRGLDPRIGTIVAVGLDLGPEFGTRALTGEEVEILTLLDRVLRDLPPGLVCTWNGSVFDLPWLADAYTRHGLTAGLAITADPSIIPKYSPLPGHHGGYAASWSTRGPVAHGHVDLAYTLDRDAVGPGVDFSLKPLSIAYGLAPVQVDRENVHLLDADELADYVTSDASITRELTRRALSGLLTPLP